MVFDGFEIDYRSLMSFSDQLAGFIYEQICAGNIKPGDKLPTMKEAASRTNLGVVTVNNAYGRLIKEKVLESHGRHGVFVALNPDSLGKEGTEEAGDIELTQVEREFVGLLKPVLGFAKKRGVDSERLIEIFKWVEKTDEPLG